MISLAFKLWLVVLNGLNVLVAESTPESLVKRQYSNSMTIPMVASLDNVVIKTYQRIVIPASIESRDIFLFQLTSSCSASIWNANGITASQNRFYAKGTRDNVFRTESVSFKKNFESGELPEAINGQVCVKTAYQNPVFQDIMMRFPPYLISFWFDLSITEEMLKQTPDMRVGDIILGDLKQKRFVRRTETVFEIEPFKTRNQEPSGWVTKDLVTILVDTKSGGARRKVTFDIGSPLTFLPQEMFNAIVPSSVFKSSDPFSGTGVSNDLANNIFSFAGQNPKKVFKCSLASKILGFKLNDLVIQNSFLYHQVNEDECELRIAPQPSSDLRDVTFGLHLIKQFYFLVDTRYDPPTVRFWKRVDKPLKKKGFLGKIW